MPEWQPQFGIQWPPNTDPAHVARTNGAIRRLFKIMGDPQMDEGSRESARLAFEALRKQVEGLGGQFVPNVPVEPHPAAPRTPPPGVDVLSETVEGAKALGGEISRIARGTRLGMDFPTAPQMGGFEAFAPPSLKRPPSGLFRETRIPPERREEAIARMEAESPGLPAPGLATELGFPEPGLSLNPIAPGASGRPEAHRISGEPGEFTPATGEEEPSPVPLVPEVLPADEESSDIAALRRALAEPVPKRRRPSFTRTEGIALAFLAGLKGVQAAFPFIEMKERESEREFEAATGERRERISGLAGLASLTEQSRARREAAAMRRASEEFNRQVRMFMMQNTIFQQDMAVKREARAERMANLSERRFATPSGDVSADIIKIGELRDAVSQLKPLIEAGAGGPIASGIFQSHRWAPDTVKAASLWPRVRLLISPDEIGRAGTGIEISQLGAGFYDVGVATNKGRQLEMLNRVEERINTTLRGLRSRYDPATIDALTGTHSIEGSMLFPSAVTPEPLPAHLVPIGEGDELLYDESEAP